MSLVMKSTTMTQEPKNNVNSGLAVVCVKTQPLVCEVMSTIFGMLTGSCFSIMLLLETSTPMSWTVYRQLSLPKGMERSQRCTTLTQYLYLITKTRLFKYTENFTTKNGNFSDKKF